MCFKNPQALISKEELKEFCESFNWVFGNIVISQINEAFTT